MKHRGLGMGLSALLSEEVAPLARPAGSDIIEMIDIDMIEAGPYQPRKKFELEKIQELADSISSSGLLQPIIVSPTSNSENKYKIIAGERRWRASKLAGLSRMQVIIKQFSNEDILKIALLENIQREELSAIEEAEGLEQLIKKFHYTQEQLCQKLGKSRSHIANLLRLNQLPNSVKDKLNQGIITMGHARCLIGHINCEEMLDHIIQNNLTVRRTETMVKNWSNSKFASSVSMPSKARSSEQEVINEDLILISKSLSEKLGIEIDIKELTSGGKIILHYKDPEQLDLILSKLG